MNISMMIFTGVMMFMMIYI